ncbi:WD40 repeat-like protein [Cutaneotrichosporon oleaginosum]|uniref:WD40 repeat-like protein n=1 Tax=Cutaneotrichosporon oleaginosum TaxID=879819 RepID=A0A0J0XN73_9TREE|nr:WD40 repeat-like protein [Cutaneotrichosporon oleaginosum]KLT42523.1 WD40 repeat-like protein [Cutaneotrichosporon oleaginosum]TXT07795.1 hypothetical protein COLE_04719 [Cutaneotrichosporon oleaginosum]
MSEHRKKEIEAKRAKLMELRRAREERSRLIAQSTPGSGTESPTPQAARKDVNSFVDNVIAARPGSPYSRPSTAGPSAQVRTASPVSAPGTPGRTSRLSEARVPSMSGMSGLDDPPPPPEVTVEFITTYAEIYDMPSKVIKPETYSKSVQTMVSTGTQGEDYDEDVPSRDGAGHETENETWSRMVAQLDEERRQLERELKELKAKTDNLQLQHLPDEQRQAIFAAPEFSAFLEGSSRIVQRALSDGYDYIKDYTIGLDSGYDDGEGQRVKLVCVFSDERWTAGRSVTGLDWSPKYPELVAASYNKSRSAPNDPQGIVAVWNLHLLERPEFVFHAPSDVLSVCLSPFHPQLVFGGSHSGQVLLWDTRASHLPVNKTPLSSSGHTSPIYAMKMVGTQNANSLITTSTDGLVCAWQADMLSQPQEALLLAVPSGGPASTTKTDEVSIACLDFADNETASFWVGTEEGSVYQANRFDRASAKAGLNADDVYRGHAGPVTGIHFHPSAGPFDFSDLFLTSSVDWTVKLWRARGKTHAPVQAGVPPLHSFDEADDYVFDVKWHPSHPALFGTADGTGKFDLWNLNADMEVPLVSTQVCNHALNKIAWDRGAGRKAALGGSDGKVYVYDVAEKVVTPRESEWVEFQKNVGALAAARDGGGLAALGALNERYTERNYR